MRILITGVTGQDGYYLAKLCHEQGHEVYGLVRGQNNPKLARLKEEQPYVEPVFGDLSDEFSLERVINTVRPHMVFNLGAITYIPFSWQQPHVTYDVNFLGVQRLMDVLARYGDCEAFVQASTSEMFGAVREGTIITENTPLAPISPYAISKAASHYLCRAYNRAGKLNAISAIMFNHESERRGETFVTRKITLGCTRIRAGLQTTLELGNPSAIRDWGYAPEYMEGLLLAAEIGKSDTYLFATGQCATIRQFAERCASLSGVHPSCIKYETPDNIRANDVEWLQGSAHKAEVELGWRARTIWSDIAQKMLYHDHLLVNNRSVAL